MAPTKIVRTSYQLTPRAPLSLSLSLTIKQNARKRAFLLPPGGSFSFGIPACDIKNVLD